MSEPNTNLRPPGFVVVEGPIGVGKTSLVRRLAQSFGCGALFEQAEENPFLDRFYRDPRSAAFPAQLFFLFQRSRQLEGLRQGDLFRGALISDFMFEKDRLFAELNLDRHELDLYRKVYAQLAIQTPVPDLVVYLQAPVEVLLERIQKRGLKHERFIEAAYLQRLSDSYIQFFYQYNNAPLLIVNAADIDFANNDDDYQLLREQIIEVKSGRHYFNPTQVSL